MGWLLIPNNRLWEYDNAPADPGATITSGSFAIGTRYKITNLSGTSAAQWHTAAGTQSGDSSAALYHADYVVGDTFKAAAAGAGTGKVVLADSSSRELWLKQTAGVRIHTDPAGKEHKVYTKVRMVGSTVDTMGEISKTYWDAQGTEDDDVSFRTLWETTADGESITWPCNQGSGYTPTFDAVIDWGDGTTNTTITAYNDSGLTHTYATAGEYTVRITGTFPTVIFGGTAPSKDKIKKVLQLGNVGWKNLKRGFKGCSNLTDFVVGSTTMNLNGDGSNIGECLRDCPSLSNVDFSGGNFDTSGVTNMNAFLRCSASVPVGDTALTTIDVSYLNTSNVTTMNGFFRDNDNIENLTGIETWDISSLNNSNSLDNRFLDPNSKMPTATYDALLIAWAAQAPFDVDNVRFGISTYTGGGAAEAARQTLIDTYGWIISDGGAA